MRKTQARTPTEKEDEVKAFNRVMAPFYCATSTPILNLVQDTGDDYHRATEDSPFLHSTKRNHTRSPSKPSKSVEELRRIYKRSTTQRSRRVLTSSIPYYKKVKPEENGRKNYATRSSSLNLTGESTKTKIKNFSSKYLPYYSKLQQNFVDQTRGKQANPSNNGQKKSLPTAKSVSSKPPNKAVHTNTLATNPPSHSSAALISDTSVFIHTNTLANMSSQSSVAILSKTSQTAHMNTPVNMSSQSSIGPLSATSHIAPTNSLTNISTLSPVRPLSTTSDNSPANSPPNISTQSSITVLLKTPQTAYTNTLTNVFLQSSVAILSKSSRIAHTNGPTNTSSQSSVTFLSEPSRTAAANSPTNKSMPSRSCSVAKSNPGLKRPSATDSSSENAPTPNASLTCVAIRKPDEATGRIKSLSYFLDLGDGAGTLEEWEKADSSPPATEGVHLAIDSECPEGTDRNEVESGDFLQSDNIVQGWSNDRPSTRSTEYPEETEETLVDYWFMSEDDFEDESSDDVEEGGLKMKFLQLD